MREKLEVYNSYIGEDTTIRVHYVYHDYYPESSDSPAEEAYVEFYEATIQNGDNWEDILEELSEDTKFRFEQEILEDIRAREELD